MITCYGIAGNTAESGCRSGPHEPVVSVSSLCPGGAVGSGREEEAAAGERRGGGHWGPGHAG